MYTFHLLLPCLRVDLFPCTFKSSTFFNTWLDLLLQTTSNIIEFCFFQYFFMSLLQFAIVSYLYKTIVFVLSFIEGSRFIYKKGNIYLIGVFLKDRRIGFLSRFTFYSFFSFLYDFMKFLMLEVIATRESNPELFACWRTCYQSNHGAPDFHKEITVILIVI